jgi:hypothetical protein
MILWVEDGVDLECLALRHEIAQEAVSMGRTGASTTEEGKRLEEAREREIDGSMKGKPRPTLWQRIKWYVPFLFLAIVLTGCLDDIPPPEAITGEPNYYACGYYQPPLADTAGYTVQDSTRACPDGSMPQLFEATWLDTDYDCPVIWGYVVDGSIRRRFACYSGKMDTAWPLTHKL